MNTFASALCLVLLVGATFAEDNCCADTCKYSCEVTNAMCVNVPVLVDCSAIKATCVGLCQGMCTCTTACQAKCVASRTKCDARSESGLLSAAVPICQAEESGCLAQCGVQCQVKVITAATKQGLAKVMALGAAAPAK